MRMSCWLQAVLVLGSYLCAEAQVPNGHLQIHHIDVGQGDGAVLISPGGTVVLFDMGKDIAGIKTCQGAIDYLDQLGVQQIDYIFVSHYHSDHIGCIPAVLERFPLRVKVYDRDDQGSGYPGEFYAHFVEAVKGKEEKVARPDGATPLLTLDKGTDHEVQLKVVSVGGVYDQGGDKIATDNENDLSMSILVSFGAFREEVGGDLSGETANDYRDIETSVAPSVGRLDVYKVHHHCSSYSTNDTWLKATEPTIAIISTGNGNPYHHPAEDCLERLHEAEVTKVYWTEQGTADNSEVQKGVDVIGGDISIDVAPNSKAYTVSYHNDELTDTYQIVGSTNSGRGNHLMMLQTTPMYAWSINSHFYYFMDCPAVARISSRNLRSGTSVPQGKIASDCVSERSHVKLQPK